MQNDWHPATVIWPECCISLKCPSLCAVHRRKCRFELVVARLVLNLWVPILILSSKTLVLMLAPDVEVLVLVVDAIGSDLNRCVCMVAAGPNL